MSTAARRQAIDFFFDFSSSYTYVGLPRIEALALRHNRPLNWKPVSLGALFKERGHAPPSANDVKGRYTFHDVERCAAELSLPYRWPKVFPFNGIPAARGFLWLQEQSPERALVFARRVFAKAFAEGADVAPVETLCAIAQACGADPVEFAAAIQSPPIKAQLVALTAEASQRGVFGAPTLICEGEMFWGADRIDQIDRWLLAR
jgi:2-hydroxychromene-2-carboxylate isomerase